MSTVTGADLAAARDKLGQAAVLQHQIALAQRMADRCQQPIGGERLDQKVKGAVLQRPDRHVDVAVPGHQDHRNFAIDRRHAARQFDPVPQRLENVRFTSSAPLETAGARLEVDDLTAVAEEATRAVDEYLEEHAVEDGLLAEAMDDDKISKALATARLARDSDRAHLRAYQTIRGGYQGDGCLGTAMPPH